MKTADGYPRNPSWFGEMDIWLMMDTIRTSDGWISYESINYVDHDGMTPLLKAVDGNKFDLTLWLLDNGAQVNPKYSALGMLARGHGPEYHRGPMAGVKERIIEVVHQVEDSNYEQEQAVKLNIAKLLIDRGAKVNGPGKSPLFWAVVTGDYQLAKLLIDNGARVNLSTRKATNQMVAQASSTKLLKLLIDNGLKLDKKPNPLDDMMSTEYSVKEVEMIIQAGADVEGKDSLLMRAIYHCHPAMIELLIEHGANVNHQREDGNSLLMLAASQGCPASFDLLLKAGVDIHHTNRQGQTALHLATHPEAAEKLLSYGAKIEQIDDQGQTPIFIVGQEPNSKKPWTSQPELVKTPARKRTVTDMYIQHGARLNHRDKQGRTPLIWAVLNGDDGTARRLVKAGAQLWHLDNTKRNALFYAIMFDNTSLAKFLIEEKAKINISDENGDTPLMWAIENENLSLIRLLLKFGASTNKQDKEGHTALMRAVGVNSPSIIRMLVKNEADLNLQDEQGNTPLIWAIRLGHFEAFQELLKLGADADLPDREQKTSKQWAKTKRRPDMAQLL